MTRRRRPRWRRTVTGLPKRLWPAARLVSKGPTSYVKLFLSPDRNSAPSYANQQPFASPGADQRPSRDPPEHLQRSRSGGRRRSPSGSTSSGSIQPRRPARTCWPQQKVPLASSRPKAIFCGPRGGPLRPRSSAIELGPLSGSRLSCGCNSTIPPSAATSTSARHANNYINIDINSAPVGRVNVRLLLAALVAASLEPD